MNFYLSITLKNLLIGILIIILLIALAYIVGYCVGLGIIDTNLPLENARKEEKTSKLINELKEIPDKCGNNDYEEYHILADELLLKFINNEEVTKAFEDIPKYYA